MMFIDGKCQQTIFFKQIYVMFDRLDSGRKSISLALSSCEDNKWIESGNGYLASFLELFVYSKTFHIIVHIALVKRRSKQFMLHQFRAGTQ